MLDLNGVKILPSNFLNSKRLKKGLMIQASGTHMRGVLVFMAEATLLNSAMSKYKRDHEVTVVSLMAVTECFQITA